MTVKITFPLSILSNDTMTLTAFSSTTATDLAVNLPFNVDR